MAAVIFGNIASVIFGLNYITVSNASGIRERIQNLQFLDEKTNISGALRAMRQKVFRVDRGDRPDIRNVGILISDGHANVDESLTEIKANLVQADGIRMFAIGITSDINETALRRIASQPSDDHYFTVAL